MHMRIGAGFFQLSTTILCCKLCHLFCEPARRLDAIPRLIHSLRRSSYLVIATAKEHLVDTACAVKTSFSFPTRNHQSGPNHALVVKSVSVGKSPPSAAFSQLQLPSLLFPQAQVGPEGVAFSTAARSHVHSPAFLRRQEQRAPSRVFSWAFFSQVHWTIQLALNRRGRPFSCEGRREKRTCMADCFPQEHVAFWAQTHSSPRPQQVVGLTMVSLVLWDLKGIREVGGGVCK